VLPLSGERKGPRDNASEHLAFLLLSKSEPDNEKRYPIALPRLGMPTWRRTGETKGRRTMRVLLRDLVLFSCLLAFVTGIVIAFASLLS